MRGITSGSTPASRATCRHRRSRIASAIRAGGETCRDAIVPPGRRTDNDSGDADAAADPTETDLELSAMHSPGDARPIRSASLRGRPETPQTGPAESVETGLAVGHWIGASRQRQSGTAFRIRDLKSLEHGTARSRL